MVFGMCGLFENDFIIVFYVYLITFIPWLPTISSFTWGSLCKQTYTHKHTPCWGGYCSSGHKDKIFLELGGKLLWSQMLSVLQPD